MCTSILPTAECPTKTAARDLAREFLESINLARNTPESAMTLIRFTGDRYLPFVGEHKRISTFRGYRNMWTRYLKSRSNIMLRDGRRRTSPSINSQRAQPNMHNVGPHQSVSFGSLSIRKTPRCDQFGKPDAGCCFAQGQTSRRDARLLSRRHCADARRAARAGRHDCGSGRIQWCTKGRSARVPLGELRWGTDPHLPVLLEGPRAGAKDSKE